MNVNEAKQILNSSGYYLTEKRPAYAFYNEGDPDYDEVLDAHYSWHDDDEEEQKKKKKHPKN